MLNTKKILIDKVTTISNMYKHIYINGKAYMYRIEYRENISYIKIRRNKIDKIIDVIASTLISEEEIIDFITKNISKFSIENKIKLQDFTNKYFYVEGIKYKYILVDSKKRYYKYYSISKTYYFYITKEEDIKTLIDNIYTDVTKNKLIPILKNAINIFVKNNLLTKDIFDKCSFNVKLLIRMWGYCKEANNIFQICLNTQLAALNAKYYEYVIYHEVCHLLYKDHKSDFWLILIKFIPNAKLLDYEINSKFEIYSGEEIIEC